MTVKLPSDPPTVTEPIAEFAFAHESEAEIANLLDYYGLPWLYEPRSFVLERSEQGNPIQSFTPDFYLPDYDLYLEITTVRPSLINRKNRKIRKLRESYPEINIKLFSLKDVEALLQKYRDGRAANGDDIKVNQEN